MRPLMLGLILGIGTGMAVSHLPLLRQYAPYIGLGILFGLVAALFFIALVTAFLRRIGWIKPPAEQWAQGVQAVRQYPHWEPPKSKASNREHQ